MDNTLFNNKEKTLYMQLYSHFKEMITNGTFTAGTKLPSIRNCSTEYGISRTTVETAYMQLAAEGYAEVRPQSGYYVCEVDFSSMPKHTVAHEYEPDTTSIELEPSESAHDFDFTLWQRYLKSALRNSDRLLGYGYPQGEPELRTAVCDYLIKSREVYCTPENIIIGAGTQTLLHLLYALSGQPKDIAIIGPQYKQGAAIFEDHHATVHHYNELPKDLQELNKQNIGMIYLFPAHSPASTGPMPIAKRTRLLRFAQAHNIIIAEDDYDSELLKGHIAPSLQGLDGGQCVAYLGTFSKLLLPGIRISFLVLPHKLTQIYKERMHLYNQTASKLEQLALSAFIRDGRLEQQIRRTRRRKSRIN